MPDLQELERLRTFLEKREMTLEERRQAEILLERAEHGDSTAFTRIRQAAQERGYTPTTGEDRPVAPGPLMVCPIDPSHYRIYRREIGEELVCPEHEAPLVLAEGN